MADKTTRLTIEFDAQPGKALAGIRALGSAYELLERQISRGPAGGAAAGGGNNFRTASNSSPAAASRDAVRAAEEQMRALRGQGRAHLDLARTIGVEARAVGQLHLVEERAERLAAQRTRTIREEEQARAAGVRRIAEEARVRKANADAALAELRQSEAAERAEARRRGGKPTPFRAMKDALLSTRVTIPGTGAAPLVGRTLSAAGIDTNDPKALVAAGGLAAAGGLVTLLGKAGSAAADFDQAMRNVDSIARTTSEGALNDLKNKVIELSKNPAIRQGPTDLAVALYDVYSSGKQGQEALDIVKVAAMGAGAGMTDVATSTRVLMAVMNSGVPGVTSASQAMDVLFNVVDKGVITFPELAAELGAVLPQAKAAGVSLQELGAYITVATKQGQSGAKAMTDLENLLNKLISPPAEAKAAFDELGIAYGATELKSVGLAKKLQEVTTKTRGNGDAIKAIFPDMQAYRAALTASADGGAKYAAALGEMTDAQEVQGKTADALARQNRGARAEQELFIKELMILGTEVGPVVISFLRDAFKAGKPFLEVIQDLAKAFSSLDENQQKWVAATAIAFGAGGPIVSALKMLGGFGKAGLGALAGGGLQAGAGFAGVGALGAGLAGGTILAAPAIIGAGFAYATEQQNIAGSEAEQRAVENGAAAQGFRDRARTTKAQARLLQGYMLGTRNPDLSGRVRMPTAPEGEALRAVGLFDKSLQEQQKRLPALVAKLFADAEKDSRSARTFARRESEARQAAKAQKGAAESGGVPPAPEAMAKLGDSIKTPLGEHSCAYFASEYLRKTGKDVPTIASARGLEQWAKKNGAVAVDPSQARPGDLIGRAGNGPSGRHVGVYIGGGQMIDSSGKPTEGDRQKHRVRAFRPVAGDVVYRLPAKPGAASTGGAADDSNPLAGWDPKKDKAAEAARKKAEAAAQRLAQQVQESREQAQVLLAEAALADTRRAYDLVFEQFRKDGDLKRLPALYRLSSAVADKQRAEAKKELDKADAGRRPEAEARYGILTRGGGVIDQQRADRERSLKEASREALSAGIEVARQRLEAEKGELEARLRITQGAQARAVIEAGIADRARKIAEKELYQDRLSADVARQKGAQAKYHRALADIAAGEAEDARRRAQEAARRRAEDARAAADVAAALLDAAESAGALAETADEVQAALDAGLKARLSAIKERFYADLAAADAADDGTDAGKAEAERLRGEARRRRERAEDDAAVGYSQGDRANRERRRDEQEASGVGAYVEAARTGDAAALHKAAERFESARAGAKPEEQANLLRAEMAAIQASLNLPGGKADPAALLARAEAVVTAAAALNDSSLGELIGALDSVRKGGDVTEALTEARDLAARDLSGANGHLGRRRDLLKQLGLETKALTAEQSALVDSILRINRELERTEKIQAKVSEALGGLENVFFDAFQNILDGTGNFFDDILGGFVNLIKRMAAQELAGEAVRVIRRVLGDAMGRGKEKKDEGGEGQGQQSPAPEQPASPAEMIGVVVSSVFGTLGSRGNVPDGGPGTVAGNSLTQQIGGAPVPVIVVGMAPGIGMPGIPGMPGMGAGGGMDGAMIKWGATQAFGSAAAGPVGWALAADQMLFKGKVSKFIMDYSPFGLLKKGIGGLFKGLFADGGKLGPGEWGIAGEAGPEIVWGGGGGLNILSNRMSADLVGSLSLPMPAAPRFSAPSVPSFGATSAGSASGGGGDAAAPTVQIGTLVVPDRQTGTYFATETASKVHRRKNTGGRGSRP